jgi:hypothetical protein
MGPEPAWLSRGDPISIPGIAYLVRRNPPVAALSNATSGRALCSRPMTPSLRAPLSLALLTVSLQLTAMSPAPAFEFTQLAGGVYASIRQEPVGLGVDANNLFVIGDDGVLVVDTNFGPSSTRHVLAKLRTITDKPVKYVVNTHKGNH